MHDAPPPPLDRQGIGRICCGRSLHFVISYLPRRHLSQRRPPVAGYAGLGRSFGRFRRRCPTVRLVTDRAQTANPAPSLARLRAIGPGAVRLGIDAWHRDARRRGTRWTCLSTKGASCSPGMACPCWMVASPRHRTRPDPSPSDSAAGSSSRLRSRRAAEARPAGSSWPTPPRRRRRTRPRSSAWTSRATGSTKS